MSLSDRHTILFDSSVFRTNWEAVRPIKYLKLALIFLTLSDLMIIIYAYVLEKIAHNDSSRPDIHRLIIMFLVNNNFRRSIKSSRYMSWKSARLMENWLIDFGNVLLYSLLQWIHLEITEGSLFLDFMRNEILQLLCCLIFTLFKRVNTVPSLPWKPKVTNFGSAVLVDQHIRWLKITVHNTWAVDKI